MHPYSILGSFNSLLKSFCQNHWIQRPCFLLICLIAGGGPRARGRRLCLWVVLLLGDDSKLFAKGIDTTMFVCILCLCIVLGVSFMPSGIC